MYHLGHARGLACEKTKKFPYIFLASLYHTSHRKASKTMQDMYGHNWGIIYFVVVALVKHSKTITDEQDNNDFIFSNILSDDKLSAGQAE
jgi:hypothetical protein